jgi:hypothetical protein
MTDKDKLLASNYTNDTEESRERERCRGFKLVDARRGMC